MGLLAEWRDARGRRRRAAAYLQRLSETGGSEGAPWLTILGTGSRVEREVRFLYRALAMIVAERDALDDRTASDVSRCLGAVIQREAESDVEAGSAWVARWREYSVALAVRGSTEPPATRLSRVLLTGVGVDANNAVTLADAAREVQAVRVRANEALRTAYGVASLPDDVRPSAINS